METGFRFQRVAWALLALAACLASGCAHYVAAPLSDSPPVAAQTSPAIDLSQPLDAKALASIAILANPDLQAMRTRLGVAEAQAFSARLLPDPTFSLGIDHLVSGPDPLENLVGQLGLDLAALRSGKVVRGGSAAQVAQVRFDVAWAEWQTAGQARLQAVRVIALGQIAALQGDNRQTARSLLERTLRAAGRGDLAGDQVQAARLSTLDAEDKLRTAERDLIAARYELARLLGLMPDFPLRLAPFVVPEVKVDAARLSDIAIAQRLDLKALREGYSAQEFAVHKAVLDQFPTLSLTLTGTRDPTNNKLFGPAVGFTLPLWNKNHGGIAVAQATRAQLKAEYAARLFQTRADIAAAAAGIRLAQAQRADLAGQIGKLETYAKSVARAAARGDLALSTAEVAQQSLRDKQIAQIAANQAIAEQSIALELLTGVPLEDWKP